MRLASSSCSSCNPHQRSHCAESSGEGQGRCRAKMGRGKHHDGFFKAQRHTGTQCQCRTCLASEDHGCLPVLARLLKCLQRLLARLICPTAHQQCERVCERGVPLGRDRRLLEAVLAASSHLRHPGSAGSQQKQYGKGNRHNYLLVCWPRPLFSRLSPPMQNRQAGAGESTIKEP